MLKILKSLFRPSPADIAFRKCAAASNDLCMSVVAFHESFNAVGIDLQPDETALDELGKIMVASEEPEQTADGLSVFLGCIITEQLGGSWKATGDGGFSIVGVGSSNATVDLLNDIRAPLTGPERLTPRAAYERIRDKGV